MVLSTILGPYEFWLRILLVRQLLSMRPKDSEVSTNESLCAFERKILGKKNIFGDG